MKKVRFCFGVHNHQPVGNFDWVIEDACRRSYLPFLKLVSDYPRFRFALHFSGILWDWMDSHLPQALDLVRELVRREQVELMTGGFYEPILPAIPDRDKIGQIRMLTEWIEHRFAVKPKGLWLAERVWEPTLPKVLHEVGVQYSILDDIHFLYSGLREEELHGFYVTEDEGKSLALFPIAKKLRYAIPFEKTEKTLEYLRTLATEDDRYVAIYADDGEKFGLWPDTEKLCYDEGWLRDFLAMISENLDWIEMRLFSEILTEIKPLGRIYLPTASYSEMNEWALPARAIIEYDLLLERLKNEGQFERFASFVKGGYWRNFLSKYPESNHMHKRMVYVSDHLARAVNELPQVDVVEARRHLYAAQCNCAYWHGVFGGLYLPHLRGAIFEELIRAEDSLRQLRTNIHKSVTTEITDLDNDGSAEILVTTPRHQVVVSPSVGGTIIELDDFAVTKNLVDIVGRRREGYHQKLQQREKSGASKSIHDRVTVKEEGLENLLTEDWYRRGLFIDHFFGWGAALETFARSHHPEEGDFVNQPFASRLLQAHDKLELVLEREGNVWYSGRQVPVTLSKRLVFTAYGDSIEADYRIINRHDEALDLHLGIEFGFGSFAFPPGETVINTNQGAPLEPEQLSDIRSCQVLEVESLLHRYKAGIAATRAMDIWCHPLWTVSLSEEGFERVFQGLIVIPRWLIRLRPSESWEVTLEYYCGEVSRNLVRRLSYVAHDRVQT